MDTDLVILKYEQEKAKEAEKAASELKGNTNRQKEQLAEIQSRVDELYKRLGKTKITKIPKPDVQEQKEEFAETVKIQTRVNSYDELLIQAQTSLAERGLNVDDIGFSDIIDDNELVKIIEDFDAPLPRKDKWKKADFITVFIAALLGAAIDLVLGNRDNKFTGKGSAFSNKLNEIHETKFKHKSGAPIDFQGKIDQLSFGGGNHRELSRGHDLLRFADGIKQFKTGTFSAVGYNNGKRILVQSGVNQYGKPYQEMTLISAITEYLHHMIADLFSNNSLPLPGYSFFQESSNREIRTLTADLYANGLNLKNVMIQSASAIIIELIVRIYFSIQSVKSYKENTEIKEDFSNWEAVKIFIKPTNTDKLNEMLLVAHTIVLALNVGKIIITKNLADINIAEILAMVKYGIKVLKAVAKRNSAHAKVIYHAQEISAQWKCIEQLFDPEFEEELISEMDEPLTV